MSCPHSPHLVLIPPPLFYLPIPALLHLCLYILPFSVYLSVWSPLGLTLCHLPNVPLCLCFCISCAYCFLSLCLFFMILDFCLWIFLPILEWLSFFDACRPFWHMNFHLTIKSLNWTCSACCVCIWAQLGQFVFPHNPKSIDVKNIWEQKAAEIHFVEVIAKHMFFSVLTRCVTDNI